MILRRVIGVNNNTSGVVKMGSILKDVRGLQERKMVAEAEEVEARVRLLKDAGALPGRIMLAEAEEVEAKASIAKDGARKAKAEAEIAESKAKALRQGSHPA